MTAAASSDASRSAPVVRAWLAVGVALGALCDAARPAWAQSAAPGGAPPASATVAAAPEEATEQEVSVRGVRAARSAADVAVTALEAGSLAGTQGDPAKVVQDLPGVARPSFDSGRLIVWGAAPEDTRILVDGVEIPQLFHGSAIRSTVNGDLLGGVTLTPGAYGAEYGRGLGGLLRLDTRDLPAEGLHGYVGADPLDGSALASFAPSDRVRVAIAGRYGWLDGILRSAGAPDVGDAFAIPRYSDYQAKAQFALRPGESLDVVVLGSNDDLTRSVPGVDPAQSRSESTDNAFVRALLRYRVRLDDGTEVDVVPWIGHDSSRVTESFGSTPALLDQQSFRWGGRASSRSRIGRRVALGFGLDVDGTEAHLQRSGSLTLPPREGDIAVFGQAPANETNADTWDASAVDVAPNAVVDVDLGAAELTAGLRFDAYLLETSRQTPRVGQTPSIGLSHLDGELEPRLSGRVRVSPRLAFFAAAGLYSQPPAPSDLSAVFGTPSLGAERADHVTVGEQLLLSGSLSAEVTAFYEWMTDLAVRDPSPSPKLAQALLPEGVGRSYGLELLLRQRPWRGFSGWIAYTLSRSERRDTPSGSYRLFDFDQPHVLTLVARKEVGAWGAGVRLRFARGLPRTPVIGALYDAKDDVFQPIFGAQNSIRLPDFWQLDLRVDRAFPFRRVARVLVYLEALNVTSHANAEDYVYSIDYSRRAAINGLPFLALLGARVEL